MEFFRGLGHSILEKLNLAEDAKAANDYAATPTGQYPETPYVLFHARLKVLDIKERK
jgi:hypothetical protein